MPIASVALALCLLAPVQAERTGPLSSEPSFRFGDWRAVSVLAGEQGYLRSIRVTDTEPLTFTAESHNFDAIIRVETVAGRVLAQDDDSGIARNAHLVWSAPEAGTYHMRVLSKAPYDGLAGVSVLLGELDPSPAFPREAEEAYWRMVIFRALDRDDAPAARVAAAHISSSDDAVKAIVADVEGEQRDSRELVRRLKEADGARKQHDLESVRAVLVEAFGPWSWKARSEVEASAYNDGGQLANAARLLDLELRCNTAYLEYTERIRPAWYREVLIGRQNLAVTLSVLGKAERALRLDQRTLAIAERTRPASHALVVNLKGNMGVKLGQLGDFAGARLLQESVLATYVGKLGPSSDLALRARQNLAHTLDSMGDTEGALTLLDQVIEAREANSPQSQPSVGQRLWRAKLRGDEALADELERELLVQYQARLPAGHPEILRVRGNIASALQSKGRLDEARGMLVELMEDQLRVLPSGHALNQATRLDLAWTYKRLGELEAMNLLLLEYVRHAADSLAVTRGLSAREAAAMAASPDNEVRYVLGLARAGPSDSELDAQVFRWIETRRLVSAPGFRPAATTDEDQALSELRRQARAAQRRCGELLVDPYEAVLTDAEFAEAARERDRADREFGRALLEQTSILTQVDVASLSRALPEGAAAVGFLHYEGVAFRDGDSYRTDEFLAHVVRADGRLFRVELGPSGPIAEVVRAWREAAGAPIGDAAGGDAAGGDAAGGDAAGARESFESSGARLRKLILDPVLEVLDGETILHVCLDDLLHMISIDCLPLGDGLVGDQLEIRTDVSFARLLAPERAPSTATLLVAMGGIDFEACPSMTAVAPVLGVASAGRVRTRSLTFVPLRGTLGEVNAIAQCFVSSGMRQMTLTGKGATKERLHDLAPRARILHLATHGYFSESTAPDDPSKVGTPWEGWSWRERVGSLLPGALCGLAFAGANSAPDSLGRLPGILTAEELSAVDLSQCELAVLSACETSVGLRKSGQGIASLQAALHAAGARTAICSLWKVDDSSTRALMLDFYARLTDEHSPRSAADALWEARMKLRSKRLPASHWAGWVLTGERD